MLSEFFTTAKDVYIRPRCVLPAPSLSALQQPKTYICVLLLFHVRTKYFHASNQGQIYTSFMYFASSQRRYIRFHKVTFYRCLVVGCIFLWLLSYICKPLDIIEIMSSCNTNNPGHIYSTKLQGFSKTQVAEVYSEIHIPKKQTKT